MHYGILKNTMENEPQNLSKKERRELHRQERAAHQNTFERNRMIKRIALWSVVFLAVAGTIWLVVKFGGKVAPGGNGLLADAVTASDWSEGNKTAKVTLVEYSDFQCPACGLYYPIVKKITQDFNDKILFAYRNFPLSSVHVNAEGAAWAAGAAGKQGKFWEMHDMIFENQNNWSELPVSKAKEAFIAYAKTLKLNIDQFNKDFESSEVRNKVKDDYNGGVRSGVNATPTFFINGRVIQNPQSYDEFRNAITNAINNNP